MTKLNSAQILREEETHDPNKIISLKLTEKSLSDVSCLADFKNLEKLDLRFNNLTSLEGLKFCVNLKWLSVIQNKLQNMKGIGALNKLTVLNAGKNKLKSMDEVASLVSLGALILNDNEIVSVCDLSQLTALNTLVLTRNPLRKIGRALDNLKSLEKLSLTECQLQSISSSFKSCTNLKELRLNKNEIKSLPSDLSHNGRLWELELGNNFITSWSDVEVLKSLTHLKSLNLHGNPISDNDKLVKKIKALLPTLRKFNGKMINKAENQKVSVDEFSLDLTSGQQMENPEKNTHVFDSKDANIAKASEDVEKKSKRKKRKAENEQPVEEPSVPKEEKAPTQKRDSKGKISKKLKGGELDVIDDGETSFSELFSVSVAGNPHVNDQMKISGNAKKSSDPTVIIHAKKKKSKGSNAAPALHELLQGAEIGMGGPSTWGME